VKNGKNYNYDILINNIVRGLAEVAAIRDKFGKDCMLNGDNPDSYIFHVNIARNRDNYNSNEFYLRDYI